jgi:hypothetical protein
MKRLADALPPETKRTFQQAHGPLGMDILEGIYGNTLKSERYLNNFVGPPRPESMSERYDSVGNTYSLLGLHAKAGENFEKAAKWAAKCKDSKMQKPYLIKAAREYGLAKDEKSKKRCEDLLSRISSHSP